MSLLGMAYTMIQLTLYPAVNYIVKEKHFGTAYGIIESMSNIGLFVGPLLIGSILECDMKNQSESVNISQYHQMHFFLLVCSLLAIILSVILNIYDQSDKGVLNTVVMGHLDD